MGSQLLYHESVLWRGSCGKGSRPANNHRNELGKEIAPVEFSNETAMFGGLTVISGEILSQRHPNKLNLSHIN